MKSLATTLLAGLMLLGAVSAIASSKTSTTLGFSDGGPAPMCLPTENCPPPIPNAKATVKAAALPSDGGPAPMCLPTENCPPPIPNAR